MAFVVPTDTAGVGTSYSREEGTQSVNISGGSKLINETVKKKTSSKSSSKSSSSSSRRRAEAARVAQANAEAAKKAAAQKAAKLAQEAKANAEKEKKKNIFINLKEKYDTRRKFTKVDTKVEKVVVDSSGNEIPQYKVEKTERGLNENQGTENIEVEVNRNNRPVYNQPYVEERVVGSTRVNGRDVPIKEVVAVDPTVIGRQQEQSLTLNQIRAGTVNVAGTDVNFVLPSQESIINQGQLSKGGIIKENIKTGSAYVTQTLISPIGAGFSNVSGALTAGIKEPSQEALEYLRDKTGQGSAIPTTFAEARQNIKETNQFLKSVEQRANYGKGIVPVVSTVGGFVAGAGVSIAEDVVENPLVYGATYGAGVALGAGLRVGGYQVGRLGASVGSRFGGVSGAITGATIAKTTFQTGTALGGVGLIGADLYKTGKELKGLDIVDAGGVVGIKALQLGVLTAGAVQGEKIGSNIVGRIRTKGTERVDPESITDPFVESGQTSFPRYKEGETYGQAVERFNLPRLPDEQPIKIELPKRLPSSTKDSPVLAEIARLNVAEKGVTTPKVRIPQEYSIGENVPRSFTATDIQDIATGTDLLSGQFIKIKPNSKGAKTNVLTGKDLPKGFETLKSEYRGPFGADVTSTAFLRGGEAPRTKFSFFDKVTGNEPTIARRTLKEGIEIPTGVKSSDKLFNRDANVLKDIATKLGGYRGQEKNVILNQEPTLGGGKALLIGTKNEREVIISVLGKQENVRLKYSVKLDGTPAVPIYQSDIVAPKVSSLNNVNQPKANIGGFNIPIKGSSLTKAEADIITVSTSSRVSNAPSSYVSPSKVGLSTISYGGSSNVGSNIGTSYSVASSSSPSISSFNSAPSLTSSTITRSSVPSFGGSSGGSGSRPSSSSSTPSLSSPISSPSSPIGSSVTSSSSYYRPLSSSTSSAYSSPYSGSRGSSSPSRSSNKSKSILSIPLPKLGGGSSRGGTFGVQVRRGGVFRNVGTFSSVSKAFSRGVEVTGGTLAASFRVTGAGRLPKAPKGFRTKKEDDSLVFIEKRSKRLSRRGETLEIQAAKGRKAKKKKK